MQLEVSINGQPLNLIGAFTLGSDGRLYSKAAELAELGVKLDPAIPPDADVPLDSIPGAVVAYDEALQAVDIVLGDAARITKTFDAATSQSVAPDSGFGSVLNYTAFAAASFGGSNGKSDFASFDGGSVSLDHRIYGRFGTLNNSGIIGTTTFNDADALRLDTAWSYSVLDMMMTGTAGDFISGGLAWTRPVRLGGVQFRRNFGVRPDLITIPLPEVSGSAAVPSTVDIYINNVKSFSQEVPAGPFTISNIPAVTGSGEARIVVRDATGKETETTSPFIASAELLRPGLADFSLEAGLARENYGEESFDYGDSVMGSGSFRYGFTDWLTVEAHVEASERQANSGIGLVAAVGTYGIINLAGSYSQFEGREGGQIHAGFETSLYGVNINAATTRSFGDYSDLAYETSWDPLLTAAELIEIEPLKALDRLSVGFQMPFATGGVGISALHIEDQSDGENWIGSISYARPFLWKSSLSVSAFAEFGDDTSYGGFLNISAPLGDWGYGTAGASIDKRGVSFTADAAKPRKAEPGSVGWRAQIQEGANSSQQAGMNFGTSFVDVEANLANINGDISGTVLADGAVVIADGGIFAARRIDDAFAVVDAGAEGVEVFHENRPVGRTGKSGKLLVTGLNAYEKNKIAIEPGDIPMDADFGETEKEVAPADRSGSRVDFGVKKGVAAALVGLVDSAGKPIPVGTEGTVEGGEAFVVGYDGQAYLKNLAARNVLVLNLESGPCRAEFDYSRKDAAQDFIGGVTCQ